MGKSSNDTLTIKVAKTYDVTTPQAVAEIGCDALLKAILNGEILPSYSFEPAKEEIKVFLDKRSYEQYKSEHDGTK